MKKLKTKWTHMKKKGLTAVNTSMEAPMNEQSPEKNNKMKISQDQEDQVGLKALNLWIHQDLR